MQLLPGEWKGIGTEWNIIALPFQDAPPPPEGFGYRILMNQYDETLTCSLVDDNVPNHGLQGIVDASTDHDQLVVTLDYQQSLEQQVAEDFLVSQVAGGRGLPIHHEPGLWLYMKNLHTDGINIARLARIPHGNSVLALGESSSAKGMPNIPPLTGMPIGRFQNFRTDPYLKPYEHYIDHPFMGNVPEGIRFPGFSPWT